MAAKIIDGKAIAEEIRGELAKELEELKAKGIAPGIATLLVGDDFGAKMYRGQVEKFCEEVGFTYINENPPADVTEEEVVEIVKTSQRRPDGLAASCRCGRSRSTSRTPR